MQQLHGHLLRLPGGSAVADGDMLHAVLANQAGENADSLLLFPGGKGGIDHRRVQHLAGAVHHGHLTAVAVAGVQPHGHPALHRRLHQQGLQVQGEHFDGSLAGGVGQLVPGLPLQGGEKQPVIGVLRSGADKGHGAAAGADHRPAQPLQGGLSVHLHGDLQHALLLAPVDGQDLVALQPAEALAELVIQAVDRVLLGSGPGFQPAAGFDEGAQILADLRIVGDHLRNDVGSPGQGLLHRCYALLRVNIILCQCLRLRQTRPLGKQLQSQGFQPLLLGHGGPGAALLLIGAVQVLQGCQGLGLVNGGRKFLRQLALFLNGFLHRVPPLLQIPQVFQPLRQIAQAGVVHGAVQLLPIAGNEGDGIALVQQGDHVIDMALGPVQLPGQNLADAFQMNTPLYGFIVSL